MSGSGKGGSGRPITAQPDPAVSEFTEEVRGQSRGVREQVFRQTEEALRTGGVGARIPIAQRMVESSRAATSQALRDVDASLGRAGLADSPFGQRLRAETSLQGSLATEQIFPGLAKELINQAPNLALGSTGLILGGLGTASQIGMQGAIAGRQIAAQRGIAEMQFWGQIISALLGAAGTVGGAAAT